MGVSQKYAFRATHKVPSRNLCRYMDNFTFLNTRLDGNDLAPAYERLREEYGIVKIAQFRINAAVKG